VYYTIVAYRTWRMCSCYTY